MTHLTLTTQLPRLRFWLLGLLLVLTAHTSHAGCWEQQRRCVEPGGTRIIQGLKVYRPCWKYAYEKTCGGHHYQNQCAVLEMTSHCTQSNSQCLGHDPDGWCHQFLNTFRCGEWVNPSTGVVHVDTYKTVIADYLDESQCEPYQQACAQTGERCVVPGGTRHGVHKDCWGYERHYECLTDQTSDCGELEGSPHCRLLNSHCLNTRGSQCTNEQKNFICDVPTGETEPDFVDCSGKLFCLDGSCYDTSSEANLNYGRAAAYLGALEQLRTLNPTADGLFKGEAKACDKHLLNYSNCCSDDGWGLGANLDHCNEEEKSLALKVEANSAHYIGTYCSSKTPLGICKTKTKSYCTFGSNLARMVQIGGRQQLGLSWGSKKRPDCRGLTPEELQRIDFSKIDFSDYIEDLASKITLPSDSQRHQTGIQRIQDYYEQNKP